MLFLSTNTGATVSFTVSYTAIALTLLSDVAINQ